jgi:hypothetical protein
MDSLYFRDPLGLRIELASYRFAPPEGMRLPNNNAAPPILDTLAALAWQAGSATSTSENPGSCSCSCRAVM